MTEPSDADLMVRVQAGDRPAFAELVDRYKDAIVGYLCRMTSDRDRAEDLAQETFVRLYEHAHRYREQGRLQAFLYRIATNLLRSEERKLRRFKLLSYAFSGLAPVEAFGSPQGEMLQQERRQMVSRAVAELPLLYREPLVLREIEGLSYEEISRVTGLPEGTVKSRVNRGRQRLKDRLTPYWNGGVTP